MDWKQQLVFLLVAGAATLGVVTLGVVRTNQQKQKTAEELAKGPQLPPETVETPAPVGVAAPAAPARRDDADRKAPVGPRLTEAEWEAKYAASKRAVAERKAREAADKAAWEESFEALENEDPAAEPAAEEGAEDGADAEGDEPAETKPKGRVEVVFVFTTWSAPCQRLWPTIENLAKRRDLTVLAMSANKQKEVYEKWRKETVPRFRVRWIGEFPDREVKRYGGTFDGKIPYIMILSRRKLVKEFRGAPESEEKLIEAIEEYL